MNRTLIKGWVLLAILLLVSYMSGQTPMVKTYKIGFTTGGFIDIEPEGENGYAVLANGNTIEDGEEIKLYRLNSEAEVDYTKTFTRNNLLNRWSDDMVSAFDETGYYILITSIIDKGFNINAHYNSVMKVDNDFDSLWTIDLTSQGDYASANLSDIESTIDGGCIATGGGPYFNTEAPIYKVSADGNLDWTYLGGPFGIYSRYNRLAVAQNGDIFAIGRHEIGNTTSFRMMVTKLSANGTGIWNKTFHSGTVGQGDMIRSEGFDVLPLSDGGCLVTGFQTNPGSNFGPAFLWRLDNNGNKIWEEYFYDDPGWKTTGERLLEDNNGNFLLQLRRFTGNTAAERHIIEFDIDGNIKWDQYGFDYFQSDLHMDKIDTDGGILLIGNTVVDSDDPAGFLIKTSHDGTYRAPMPYLPDNGSTIDSEPVRFEWDPNGSVQNVSVFHFQIASSNTFDNILFERTDLAKNFIGIDGFQSDTDYYWRVRAKGPEGGTGLWSDGWLLTTGTITSVDNLNRVLQHFSVIPNPLSDEGVVELTLAKENEVCIRFVDISGKTNWTLIQASMQEGEHFIPFNTSDLSNGIYFCQLEIEGKIIGKKVIVLK